MNDCIRNHPELLCGICTTNELCMEDGCCSYDGMDINYDSENTRLQMYGMGSPMLKEQHEHLEPLFEPVIKTDQEHILYRVFDDKFRLLYAGVTLNMYQRFNGHKHTAEWWTHAKHIMIERFESRAELMAAERRVIVTERPQYNKQHNGGS